MLGRLVSKTGIQMRSQCSQKTTQITINIVTKLSTVNVKPLYAKWLVKTVKKQHSDLALVLRGWKGAGILETA